MLRMPTIVLFLLTLVVAVPASARADEPDALGEAVRKLMRLDGEQDAQLGAVQAAAKAAGPEALAKILAQGRPYATDAPTGWLERTSAGPDGVLRPYLLFVPETYTPTQSYRLLVDMHGGVSRPQLLDHAGLERMRFFWGAHAEAHGYLLAIPAGQGGAEWWSPVGSHGVLDLIKRIRRKYNIDENQVLATGFSDGGSGCYYMALAHATPFAGFIPLNGHIGVAAAQGLQVHVHTLINKPIYAVNTENDSLYPSKRLKPIMEAIQGLGAPLVWRDIPDYQHDPSYLPGERPAIAAWMDKTQRTPHPKQVVWAGGADHPGRIHWLQVTRVADVGNNEQVKDVNPAVGPGRVRIGINVDQAFGGPGVKVTTVSKDSPAAAAHLEAGDVIVGFDDVEITGLRDLRGVLSGKKFGDGFALKVLRGETSHDVKGTFPARKPSPAFDRAQVWGHVRATVTGNVIDVHVLRIAAFEIYLSPALVDLAQPVIVKVNGAVVHEGIVPSDTGFMLAQARADEDRTLIYWSRLALTVFPAAPTTTAGAK